MMWPFRKEAAPVVATQAESDGPLFGLDPPEGCQFKVHFSGGCIEAWFVAIVNDGKELSRDLSLVQYDGADDACIKRAAGGALAKYARQLSVQSLEGCYPPKRTDA